MKGLAIIALALGFISGGAHASGFVCTGHGYNVKLFNKVNPDQGTRVPSVLVISNVQEGTLLVAKGAGIQKRRLRGEVVYTVAGNEAVGAESVSLAISFVEGAETLADGEEVSGRLELIEGGDIQDISLACARYLKRS